jgi:hypothetical protein
MKRDGSTQVIGRHVDAIGVLMPDVIGDYVLSIQAESFYRGVRYHWVICLARNPDRMVSWGHAPTRELAGTAAKDEIKDLTSGFTKGGRAVGAKRQMIYRR